MFSKLKILVLTACVFAMQQLSAQDALSIGPRVGVNFSTVSHVDNSKSLTGLALGLTSTYSINETAGLTLDLLYSGQGYKVANDEVKINYLQIPLYFDVFFGKLGEKIRPKVYVGIAPQFLLSSKSNGLDSKDNYNPINLALTGGLGFNARVASRIWLNTDLRAFLGLNDIRAKSFQSGSKWTGSSIQFSLGLAYGLSKLD
ncbi:MAG: porin family protein [Saprospiraceae bacterium]